MEERLYIGIDESNHGRYPEVFVAVFSNLNQDIIKPGHLSKKRPGIPFNFLNGRDYSFLLVNKHDLGRLPKKELTGVVLSSLFSGKSFGDFSHLDIFIDGSIDISRKIYSQEVISEVYEIPKKNISIESGSKFDQTYPIVNFADSIAHYIFRNLSVKEITSNKNQKYLLR